MDALTARTDQVRALGGTVTATTSVRYGDISGPPRAHQLELRASWTATTPIWAPMSRRSATSWSTRPACRQPGSPTWARGHAPDMCPEPSHAGAAESEGTESEPTPCSGPPVGYRICV